MAKKKPSRSPRKRARVKDLPPAGGGKVKGGSLLLSARELQASRLWAEGNGQPPDRLLK